MKTFVCLIFTESQRYMKRLLRIFCELENTLPLDADHHMYLLTEFLLNNLIQHWCLFDQCNILLRLIQNRSKFYLKRSGNFGQAQAAGTTMKHNLFHLTFIFRPFIGGTPPQSPINLKRSVIRQHSKFSYFIEMVLSAVSFLKLRVCDFCFVGIIPSPDTHSWHLKHF